MRKAEHNTGLALLQQELDKFNEDRQGNKEEEGQKKEPAMAVGQTNEERLEEQQQQLKEASKLPRIRAQDCSSAMIHVVIKLLKTSEAFYIRGGSTK